QLRRASGRLWGPVRLRLEREGQSSRAAQRSRITPSRGGPSQQGIPCGAPASTSGAIWTEPILSGCHRLSVQHPASDQVPSAFRRLTCSTSDQRHVVALSYTLSRDTTRNSVSVNWCLSVSNSDQEYEVQE